MKDSPWNDDILDRFPSARGDEDESELEDHEEIEESSTTEELEGLLKEVKRRPYMTRFLLVLLLLPSLIYCCVAINDILTKYPISSQWLHLLAVIFGGAGATLISLRIPWLRYNLTLIVPLVISVMCLPSYQVYMCSPLYLNNTDLGKMYKVKTSSSHMIEKAYLNSACFNKILIQTPYSLSLYTPSFILATSSSDIVDLYTDSDDFTKITEDAFDESSGPVSQTSHFFLIRSKRTVKGTKFNLYLLVKIPSRTKGFDLLTDPKKLVRNKAKFQMFGRIKDLDDTARKVYKRVSSRQYVVRPILFAISTIKEV